MSIDFQFPSLEMAISTILTLLFLILVWKKFKSPTPNLPPGPWKLPLLGSMHHLIGGLPHHKMRDLAQKYGPIMHLQLGEFTNIVISSPEVAKQVLKTHDAIFCQRPPMSAARSLTYGYKDITFAPYGDYWRQLRKISTTELLVAKRVLSFRSIREEEASKLIESISSRKPGSVINFTRTITSLNYCMTSRAAHGKILEGDQEMFVTCLENIMMELGRGVSIGDAYPSMKWLEMFSRTRIRVDKLQKQLDGIFESILEEHRSSRTICKDDEDQKDLVHVLLNMQEKGDLEIPLSDDSIKALILDMFLAGVDASAATIEWTMSELMKNPKTMEKAQEEIRKKYKAKAEINEIDLQEIDYLKLVIKESLRLHPPGPFLVRECMEKCVIDGYDIPKNSKVIINGWAMGRDPKCWEDSEKFKPERFIDSSVDFRGNNIEFVPFGSGRRSCPGIVFGLANVELPLAKLLFHFDWKLVDGIEPEDLDMNEEVGVSTRRKSDLCIIPILPTTSSNY
ncbi:cytochrome P450 family 71 subfamily B polypeptide 2 [Euphorbia peplus]|nr:putative cytochrome P450 monooxygenase [Euphorbia peplus]WCJ37102.1 cytochrome P450 family 71 subfamily B polypeptide 2 [Euphorbia peplus]